MPNGCSGPPRIASQPCPFGLFSGSSDFTAPSPAPQPATKMISPIPLSIRVAAQSLGGPAPSKRGCLQDDEAGRGGNVARAARAASNADRTSAVPTRKSPRFTPWGLFSLATSRHRLDRPVAPPGTPRPNARALPRSCRAGASGGVRFRGRRIQKHSHWSRAVPDFRNEKSVYTLLISQADKISLEVLENHHHIIIIRSRWDRMTLPCR